MDFDELKSHELFAPRNSSFDTNQYLYHYTRWERLIEICFSMTFRMNNLERMNDPRESKAWFVGTTGHNGPPNLSDIDMAEVSRALAKYKSMVRVAAFAQDLSHDDREPAFRGAGFARPTMWAHYAGNHTGCCIVFDKQRLLRRVLEESTHLFDSPSNLEHGPVAYGIDAFTSPFEGDASLRPIGVESIRQLGAEAAVRRHFARIGPGIWFQKHSDWGAEVEYRFIFVDPVGARTSIEVDITECVAALIVGADYQEAHLSIARDFNAAFDLQGCVAKAEWVGPHWAMQDIDATDAAWRWGPHRRVVTHAGTAVHVVMPPLENPIARFEPPFSDEVPDGSDEG
jgi:hypothetical protein